ncbi:MAG TPA: hypothetical protein DDZ80_09970 [Cyanobacteria bacterium UBA8803]|nr:hypothetical protein [Cyanobacteria bacterium UBA9273]HBL58819.1 hypothetical protein [Cyanobacteria bacterium UBA8803]
MDSNTANDGNTPKALEPIQRATVEEILEHYRDHPQASAMLDNHYHNTAHDCHEQEAIFRQIMTLEDYYRDHPLPLALLQDRVENDIYLGIREAAVEAIGKYYHDDPQTYSWLCDRALNSKDGSVRQAAVEAIGKYYHDEPQTYSWLCDRALNSEDGDVRQAAVEAIGKYYQDNPQTYSWLCDRYQNDEEAGVRQVALRQIAQHSPNNPQTIALLHDCLNNTSQSIYIRKTALLQIAEHYHDDPQTLPLLQDWLQRREQGEGVWGKTVGKAVQKAVLIALVEYYKDDPKAVSILHEYARQGENDAVRLLLNYPSHPETFAILRHRVQSTFDKGSSSYDYDALKIFVKHYHEHPQTLSMLMEGIQTKLSKEDRVDGVAKFALNLLMEYYSEHPETLPFLLSSVERSNNTFSETERRMIDLLVRHYRDDPRVLPFLKQIAQNHSNSYLRTDALYNMAWGYGSNPETLSFLQQRIQAEQGCDDPIMIWYVMGAIGNSCTYNPQTLPWLKELAHDTGNDKLRNAAIEVLGEHFLSDPETYKLLSDIARHEPDEQIRLNAFRAIAKYDAQTKKEHPDESETLPEISIEIPEIPTECDSDYTRLCELLKAQLWREAVRYTNALIREKLERKAGSVIRLEEVLTLSSEVLQTIDRLWTSTSCGHFGFSIQREIYLQCGGTLDGKYPGDEVWQAFCKRVGWIVAGFLGNSEDIKCHLSAPAGHLPLWAKVGEYGDCRYEYIFSDRKPPEIDYTKLRNLLAAGQWKEADYETYLLMLQIVGREPGETISEDQLSCFPCTELQTIDQLWIDASQGRFGFSIQKDIYLQSGGLLDSKHPSTEVRQEFNRRVGWYVEDSGIWYENLTFSEDLTFLTFSIEAPVGHLPTPCWRTYYRSIYGPIVIDPGLYNCIFPRLEACKTS